MLNRDRRTSALIVWREEVHVNVWCGGIGTGPATANAPVRWVGYAPTSPVREGFPLGLGGQANRKQSGYYEQQRKMNVRVTLDAFTSVKIRQGHVCILQRLRFSNRLTPDKSRNRTS